jgi:predicted transcriptional regulator
LYILLQNTIRQKILNITYQNPKNISELRQILNVSYKTVFNNVKILKANKLVTLDKKMKDKHQPVYVESIYSLDELYNML